ncbi:MAG: hypothetical protein ACKODN_10550, partial [Actinomycetota bacterium]
MAQSRSASGGAVNVFRRLVVISIVIATAGALVVLARRTTSALESVVTERPVVPEFRATAKASTWFCPGV